MTVPEPAHIIVFGSAGSGAGRTTAAIQVAVALLRLGYRTGTLDLDSDNPALTRWHENRKTWSARAQLDLPMPLHMAVGKSRAAMVSDREYEEERFVRHALRNLSGNCDFVVADTPEADSFIGNLAHGHAGTLVTPVRDGPEGFATLAALDPDTGEIQGPAPYTAMVEEKNVERIMRGDKPFQWIVMRNRGRPGDEKNAVSLDKMAGQFGFWPAAGFAERPLFNELYGRGLALLDLRQDEGHHLSVAELAARQEARNLVCALAPEKIRKPARRGQARGQK